MPKHKFLKSVVCCQIILVLAAAIFAQTLTVRDIMREPSIAGMRPDSEKLSPDGKLVVFSWNSEGKESRDIYLVSTDGTSQPRIIVDAEKNYEQRTSAPESKLNYGLIVRDDFTKAREKNLGGAEFSPNSKRLLFTQNSDIYVLDLEETEIQTFVQPIEKIWQNYQSAIMRRADLIPGLVESAQKSGIQEQDVFGQIARTRSNLLNMMSTSANDADKNEEQQKNIIAANDQFDSAIKNLMDLQKKYPKSSSNENFNKYADEISGVENRINVARADYRSLTKNSNPRRIMRTQGAEFAARWLDDATILYQSNGNFYALNIEKTFLAQLTKEANPQAFINVSFATPTEDAKLMAYVVSDGSKQRALFVPNYLDEFVQAPTFRRGFTDQKIYVVKTDGSSERATEVKIPKPEGASYLRGIRWAADNRSLIVDRVDKDTKHRQIFYVYNVGGKDEQTIPVFEETDEKWIGGPSRTIEPNPKNAAQILFSSEKDGFNHLYLATLEPAQKTANSTSEIRQENASSAGFTSNVAIKQLTKGAFETDWAKWKSDGKDFIFSSTQDGMATRDFYVGNPNGAISKFFGGEQGMKASPQLSETAQTDDVLLFEASKWNQPSELYVFQDCSNCDSKLVPRKLTNSTPENFLRMKWNAPQFIDIPARDGKTIKSKIYTPADFTKTKKYPMVIFVHGAGYLQNTINGWNNYYREFMFNEMLTQKGYVVLDIDYRGSLGYGRDWRTDVYDFLGGKDYEDHLDAIDFAVKNYAVDARKIGVYGGSYGGFMAEMLVFRSPERIAAAAALRPVADWKNYFASSPVYTTERLNFPDKNPEGYKRSSPISYADKLQKPLLILHGVVDDNVPAQDSMQLIEKLIRLEKTEYFEAMFYPSENHGFTRPTSWADEYGRIFSFFEKHLKIDN